MSMIYSISFNSRPETVWRSHLSARNRGVVQSHRFNLKNLQYVISKFLSISVSKRVPMRNLVFIWLGSHLDSFWKRGKRQLGNDQWTRVCKWALDKTLQNQATQSYSLYVPSMFTSQAASATIPPIAMMTCTAGWPWRLLLRTRCTNTSKTSFE